MRNIKSENNSGKLRFVNVPDIGEPEPGPFRSRFGRGAGNSFLARACLGSLQAYSPTAQAKAVAAQVGGLNWNGEKKKSPCLL
jgi:hypothetical protein